jgi:hypothetical protein
MNDDRAEIRKENAMRTKIAFSVIYMVSVCFVAGAVTPVSLIGSNPYFTSQLSPQDLLLRQGNYLYYYPQYQSAPWWGDISEPTNKPSTGDYTVTGVDVIEGKASFKHIGSMQTVNNNLGYAWLMGNNLMADFKVNYSIDALRNTASGNMIGTYDSAYTFKAGGTLPFEYSSRHTLNRFSVQGMVGSMYKDFPIGIKFSGGFENTMSLKRDLSFSKLKEIDSAVFVPDSMIAYHYTDDQARVLWGWNTNPCNHIFGVKGPQGDSWLKYDYAIGPVYNFDLLGGITLPKVKAGLYYRFKQGHQDQYYWESKPRDSTVVDKVIWDNFNGSYQKQDFSRVKGAWELRAFGNINQRSGEHYALNTFVSLGYVDSTTKYALSNNLDMEQYNKPIDAIRSIGLEVEPNINVKYGEFLNFLDAALLFDYRYTRFSNTFETDVSGGRQRVFQSATVYMGDDYSNYDFSYANQNSIHLGADFSTMFPVFTGYPHHLSLGLMLVGNLRYTFQTKYYGTLTNGNFTLDNRRINYQREVWFNSFLMLHYVQGPYQLRFEVTEPILYSLLPSTQVTNSQGSAILYEHEKSPLWVSQLGMRAAIYASYDIVLPFARGLHKGQY